MQSCSAAKLLMFAALIATAGAHAQTPEGGLAPDPLPKLPRDPTYVLDASLERVRQSWSIPGMAIGIVENGEPVYVRAFGVRDVQTGEPVTVHTGFNVASITTTFTATAVMQLVEQQQLALDARIAQYVPASESSSITVTQVLTHRASASEDADASFNLLGAAIESVTKTDYARHMQEHVLTKAGMNESTFEAPAKGDDIAWPHAGKVFVRRSSSYPWDRASLPSMGLNASINDMARWAALHLNRDPVLLSPASYEAIFLRQPDGKSDYAGRNHGFTTSITLYPQQRRAIVILSNAETTPTHEIRKLIESLLDTGSYVAPQPPLLLRISSPWVMGGLAVVVVVLLGVTVSMFRQRSAGRT